jgi:hypothetical protein
MGRSFPGEGAGRAGMPAGPAGGMRPLPPGGVIGGTPGVGLSKPAIGRGSAPRVNPVGGVIGNSTGEPGTNSRALPTPGQTLTNGGGRRRTKADETIVWDPDNPWETAEGVSPVVLPAVERRVDPGPAIGLD